MHCGSVGSVNGMLARMVVRSVSGPRGSLLEPVCDVGDLRRGLEHAISLRCARTLIAVVRVGGLGVAKLGGGDGRLSGVCQPLHT